MSDISVNNVFVFETAGSVKAIAKVTVNGVAIDQVRIVSGSKGLFVSMPQRKTKEDKYVPIVSILDKATNQELSQRVLETYENKICGGEYREADTDVPF